jgi:hypothetical protein
MLISARPPSTVDDDCDTRRCHRVCPKLAEGGSFVIFCLRENHSGAGEKSAGGDRKDQELGGMAHV